MQIKFTPIRVCVLRLLFSLTLFASTDAAFAISTIQVRYEVGLNCCTVVQEWTLEQNDLPTVTSWDNGLGQSFDFDLAYSGDYFMLTAQTNNDVAGHPYSLQLLAVYPGGVPPVGVGGTPPDCGGIGGPPCVNVIDYIQIYRFPDLAGESVSVYIPPVPEPSFFAISAAGLLTLAGILRRRNVTRP